MAIVPGTIETMVSRCADKAEEPLASIRRRLKKSKINNFDETSTSINGKKWWVHTSCNPRNTYLTVNKKRGADGTAANGILPFMHGVAIHDCWKPYWTIDADVEHAVCNAHLLRELNGIIDNHPDQEWASDFQKRLISMKKTKQKALKHRVFKLSYYHLHKFDKKYDELIEKAYSEAPVPQAPPGKRGKKRRGKILSLIDRLKDYKESVCLFIKNYNVPFDNNEAERSIRNVKTKTKVAGCFRTENGANDYLRIMSVVETAKKRGHSGYEAISYIINLITTESFIDYTPWLQGLKLTFKEDYQMKSF